MTKNDVIEYFGTAAIAARSLRISRQALHKWPEELTDRIAWRVELVTHGKLKSKETLKNAQN